MLKLYYKALDYIEAYLDTSAQQMQDFYSLGTDTLPILSSTYHLYDTQSISWCYAPPQNNYNLYSHF
jgi:hypothetical protein